MSTGSIITWGYGCVCIIAFAEDLPFGCLPSAFRTKVVDGAYSFLLVFLTAMEILRVNEVDVVAAFYQWLAVCFTCNFVI